MREIALHLLDIAENSVAAGAKSVAISVREDLLNDRLEASVTDNGKGMDAELLAKVTDPFTTSRTTRKVGLGIPLFKAAAEACNGSLEIHSTTGKGTCLEVSFQHSHIDRMPLGDLAGTFLTLVVAYPEIDWSFRYRVVSSPSAAEKEFIFDSQPVREALGDIPYCEPQVLAFLRDHLEAGVANVQPDLAKPMSTQASKA